MTGYSYDTDYTYDDNLFSDLYKETFGNRPRGHEYYYSTPERKQQIWNNLLIMHERAMKEYAEMERRGIADFEAAVTKCMMAGAKDRETAIQWMADAAPDYMQGATWNEKLDLLTYEYNLPWPYLMDYREDGVH